MDNFSEYLVKRRRKTHEWIYLVVIVVAAIILAFLTLTYYHYFGSALVFTGFLFAGYFFIKYTNTEYEYTQTNVFFDIDRINGQSRRKRILSAKITDFLEFEPLSIITEDVVKNKVKIDLSSGSIDDTKKYYFILNTDRSKYYIIEPNQKMLDNIKMYYRNRA